MSTLIEGIDVLTPDDAGRVTVVPRRWVLVSADRIAGLFGSAAEAVTHLRPGDKPERVSGKNLLLLPAYANTHNHLAMTLLRNQTDDQNLHDWLYQTIFPREARLDADIVAAGTRLAIAEMIRCGTGASAEMYFYPEAAAEAAVQCGFRLNLSISAQSREGSDDDAPDRPLFRRRYGEFTDHPSGLLKASLLVHSVYLNEERLYPQMAALAEDCDCPVQVHLAETRREVDDCLARYGRRPAAQLLHWGFLRTRTVAAHAVHLNDEDRELLRHHPVTIAHCPASNLKLASGIADLAALRRANIPYTIGTDGAASNNTLDMTREIRLAALLAKASSGDPTVCSAEEMLRVVTATAHKTLGFAGGQITTGAPADLQMLRTDRLELTPAGNWPAALIYSASSEAVDSLMVAGRWLMRKRQLLTIDEERVRTEAARCSTRLSG